MYTRLVSPFCNVFLGAIRLSSLIGRKKKKKKRKKGKKKKKEEEEEEEEEEEKKSRFEGGLHALCTR